MKWVQHQVNKLHWCSNSKYTCDLTGDDYTLERNETLIPAGQMQAPFNVSIKDDDIAEGNRNFILIISSVSLSSKISVANPERANVIIVDNDG